MLILSIFLQASLGFLQFLLKMLLTVSIVKLSIKWTSGIFSEAMSCSSLAENFLTILWK